MGITSQSSNESGEIQTIQIEGVADEVLEEVQNLGVYGLTSAIPQGSEVIVGFIGGNRDLPFVLAVGNSLSRPKDLKEGEVILYSKYDNSILLNEDGEVILNSGVDYAVAYEKLKTEFNELNNKFNDFVSKYNLHTHGSVPVPLPSELANSSIANIDNTKVEKVRL